MVRGRTGGGIPLEGAIAGLGLVALLAYVVHTHIKQKTSDPVAMEISGEVVVDAMERMAQNPILVTNNRETLMNYVESGRGAELAALTGGVTSQVQLEGKMFAFAKRLMEEELDIPVKPIITPGEVFGVRAAKMAEAYSLGL